MNYTPVGKTVVCGRGKVCVNSPGNKHLQSLVKNWLQKYSKAKTKMDKSAIVSCILRDVKQATFPEPAFVKPNKDKVYCEVTDAFAREKIGGMFRDLLHTQYKSSNKAKNARKRAKKPAKCLTDQREVTSVPRTIYLVWEKTNDTTASPTYYHPEDCQHYVHPIPMDALSCNRNHSKATRLPFLRVKRQDFSKSCHFPRSPPATGLFKTTTTTSCRPPLIRRAPQPVSISLIDSFSDSVLNDDDFSIIDDLDLPTSMSDLFC